MSAQSKRRLKRFGIVLGAAVCMAALLPNRDWARALEDQTVDFRLKYFNPNLTASPRVVVIDIDEQSLKELESSYGRWPLPRRVYKDLLAFLSAGGPKAVLFDILFAGEMRGGNEDRELGEISRELENISHAISFMKGPEDSDAAFAPLPLDFAKRFSIPVSGPHDPEPFADYVVPAGPILDRTHHVHVVTFPADSDGVLRRGPMLFSYGGESFPSLSLAAAHAVWGSSRFVRTPGSLRVEGAAPIEIPIDEDGRMPILYYPLDSGPKSIPLAPVLASARALLSGDEEAVANASVSPSEFKDAVVIIGGSAIGLNDLKSTPLQSVYPGAKVQATAASNLIEGHFLRRPSPIWAFLAAFLLVALVQAGLIFPRTMALKLILPLTGLVLYTAACALAFQKTLWICPMALPLGMGFVALFDGLTYVLWIENRDRRKLASTLNKYLAPSVAKQLMESGNDPRAEVGREEEISILFSDIRDFTTISEGLGAGQVVSALNAYLARMTDCVFDHSGTLDKFIGDAVMAFWGAPLADGDHPAHAVRCALAMHKMLQDETMPWRTTAEFRTGIGINTGKAIVGNIGSEKRLDYTAIGDNVNLASRIEGMTKQFQVGVLVAEATFQGTEKGFVYRWIDEVQVKGKTRSVHLYQPLAERGTAEATRVAPLVMKYEEAVHAYRWGDYEQAARLFEILAQEGDGPSRVYLERSLKNIKGGKAAYG